MYNVRIPAEKVKVGSSSGRTPQITGRRFDGPVHLPGSPWILCPEPRPGRDRLPWAAAKRQRATAYQPRATPWGIDNPIVCSL